MAMMPPIHQTAGLAEEAVLGVLRQFRDFHVADLAVVVNVVENVSDHVLERGGRGDARAFEHVGGGVSVKAADRQSLLAEARDHAGNQRIGFFVPRGVGRVVNAEVHNVLGEALALDPDDRACRGGGDRNDVEVDGGGDHATVVMVGVVAGKLASARNRVERRFAIRAVELFEFFHRVQVARLLRLQRS